MSIRGRRARRNPYKKLCFVLSGLLFASIIQNRVTLAELNRALDKTAEVVSVAQHAVSIQNQAIDTGVKQEPVQPEFVSTKTLTVTATAYCPCELCCGVWSEEHPSRKGTGYVQKTSSGTIPTEGRTIATDPSIIPCGTKVIIEGKEYIAEDTGSGVKGNHIDVFFESHEAALEWGVKTLEVTLIEE